MGYISKCINKGIYNLYQIVFYPEYIFPSFPIYIVMGNLEHPGGGPTPRLERLDDDHDNDASMMELIPPAIKGKMNKHMLQKKK